MSIKTFLKEVSGILEEIEQLHEEYDFDELLADNNDEDEELITTVNELMSKVDEFQETIRNLI